MRRADPSPAREKKAEPRELFRPGSAKGAPWLGRSIAARSPARERARRRGGRRRCHGRLLHRFARLVAARYAEERGEEERKDRKRMMLGLRGADAALVLIDRNGRSAVRFNPTVESSRTEGQPRRVLAAARLCRPRPTFRPGKAARARERDRPA